jgi:hypothetical protein
LVIRLFIRALLKSQTSILPRSLVLPRAMPLFWKPYRSEVTQFIDELKKADPQLEERQRAGRALLWDRPVDREKQADWQRARVAQQPYVYQTQGD